MGGFYFQYLLESHYAEKELYQQVSMSLPIDGMMEFQIPLTWYPQPNRPTERVEGQFKYGNQIYNKYEQRIHGDTLYLVCFNNGYQQAIEQSLFDNIADNLLDTHKAPLQGKSSKIFKLSLTDYLQASSRKHTFRAINVDEAKELILFKSVYYVAFCPDVTNPPPQA